MKVEVLKKGEALLRGLLLVGALLEGVTAVALLALPLTTVSLLLGEPALAGGPILPRVAGGALLGLAVSCWFARNTPQDRASMGVAGGLAFYNLAATLIFAQAGFSQQADSLLLWPVVVLHGLLAVALFTALIRIR